MWTYLGGLLTIGLPIVLLKLFGRKQDAATVEGLKVHAATEVVELYKQGMEFMKKQIAQLEFKVLDQGKQIFELTKHQAKCEAEYGKLMLLSQDRGDIIERLNKRISELENKV